MRSIKETRNTPVVAEVDVVVAGGGPAGIAAATAAARCGAKVILIERYGYLGGLATGGLVLYMDHLFDRNGQRCINGITWEIMERLTALGGIAEDTEVKLHADSELLKIAADEICVESGVTLRLHSWVVDGIVEDGRVNGVIVESKSGRQAIYAHVCIDATGDGDIAAFAGAGFEMHTMRIGLNAKIGGVDRSAFRTWRDENPDESSKFVAMVRSSGGCPMTLGPTPYSDDGVFWVNDLGIARRADDGKNIAEGNDKYIGGMNAVDVEELSYIEVESRRRILKGIELYKKHVPGYEKVQLLYIASQLGVRDSRRIAGEHRLTKAEMDQNSRFEDTIGLTAMSFKEGNHLRVPYRALVPEKIEGLLTAGRCISVGDGLIHSLRLIPPCMMTGQAAGTAAALSAAKGIKPRELSHTDLQKQLRADGVIIDD